MSYPKFEKVNNHTIKIVTEKAEEVSISALLVTLKQLEEKRDQILQTINNINEILTNAVELGITPEEKDKDITC